ncbi:hypothetical protein JVT61DRAFT_15418 [Boletus reticuloceps]|uniref:Uncharacterized protein n=1 Tax=Boletus reticuloceps TaxID=495285 RepID=A0A8I3ACR7_9AGAM|nr:hypothetical protein JVT61DRAFT_15418 [Boletus reticuloceps]
MNAGTNDNIAIRPKRATVPSARLRDTENAATPELRSHQASNHGSPSHTDDSPHPSSSSTSLGQKRKRANNPDKHIDLLDSDNEGTPIAGKRVVATAADNNGLLPALPNRRADIQVVDINEPHKVRREQRDRDVDHFFDEPIVRGNDGKKYRNCKCCSYVIQFCLPITLIDGDIHRKPLIAEISTLCRHLQSCHQVCTIL